MPITTAIRYTEQLDRILQLGPLTNDLNINPDLVGELTGVGQIKIAKLAMDGLADHTRGGGFTKGDITLTWETVSLAYDRSREFDIDNMDDDETLGVVTASAMGEFARTKVVPEVDAIRLAKLSAAAPSEGTAAATTYSAASAAYDAVLTAEEFIQDYGSALQDCVFYCAPYVKTLLRKACADNFQLRPGEGPNSNFMTFDEMKLVTVPKTRFYTAIDLLDGITAGETAGGYQKGTARYAKTTDSAVVTGKTYYTESNGVYTAVQSPSTENIASYYELVAAAGCDINFMIVNPESAEAIVKHNPLRYFAPEVNQSDDAHKWQYRLYHDLFVYENKVNGIYLSAKSA